MAVVPKATVPCPAAASHSLHSKGNTKVCPNPAPAAHGWGRAVSASHPSALDPRSKLSRDMETFVRMLQKSTCSMAGWRMHNKEAQNTWAVQPLGQLSPAPGHDWLWVVSLGGLGLNRGGPPPSVGRQDLALALLWLWQGVQWEAWRFSILSVPEISSCRVLNTNFVYAENSEDKWFLGLLRVLNGVRALSYSSTFSLQVH